MKLQILYYGKTKTSYHSYMNYLYYLYSLFGISAKDLEKRDEEGGKNSGTGVALRMTLRN